MSVIPVVQHTVSQKVSRPFSWY